MFGANEGGHDHITDFNVADDFLHLSSSLFQTGATIDAILNSAAADGSNNAVLSTSNGATITFDHVTVSQLQSIDHSHVLLAA